MVFWLVGTQGKKKSSPQESSIGISERKKIWLALASRSGLLPRNLGDFFIGRDPLRSPQWAGNSWNQTNDEIHFLRSNYSWLAAERMPWHHIGICPDADESKRWPDIL